MVVPTDNEEVIQRRLLAAREEISHAGDFDYVVVNDHVERATQDLLTITQAERLRSSKHSILQNIVIS